MIGADIQHTSTRPMASSSSANPASIAFISSEVLMETYITLSELPWLNDEGSQGIASATVNFDSEFSDFRAMSPSPPPENLAKRAKITSSNNGDNAKIGPSKRVRGRLSELPTMPLDILYEILGHLPPSDLLSLSRVTKAFRQLLMSRRSLFLWKTSYSLVPEVPTCPEDMSEPAWAHLLFGGAYCYSCGAKPVAKILFSLRRRACKSCMRVHLRCARSIPMEFRDAIPCDTGHSRAGVHRSWGQLCIEHWWDEDVEAFRDELNSLKRPACDQDGFTATVDTDAVISEFFERKKKSAADIKEHAIGCLDWEKDRNADRNSVLSDVKAKRFEAIRARFIELGYLDEDIDELRRHHEVNNSKPMSDRVWQRIEPLLIPEINKARDLRLRREGRYLERRAIVLHQYVKFIQTLSPLLLALSPTLTEFLCGNRNLADAVALDSDPIGHELEEQTREAISRLMPELEARKLRRAIFLRSLLPDDDAPEHATDEEVLALATSVFECVSCHQRISGLHMLAHRCRGPQKSRSQCLQFSEEGRKTVEALLELLGLGKETTALELDRRDDRFVCMRCPLLSFGGRGMCAPGRYARDWRSCVSHAIGPKQERRHKGAPDFILVGETETAGMPWGGDRYLTAYSCMRCPLLIMNNYGNIEWRGLDAIKDHINQE
ncbi:hypothetical protein BJV78DRAFT_591563 [Lactifluus subvellereus]|nr:hypothetical protein BJV78DRAFT_591563 [Lactifluus subvellereus]